MKKVNRTLAVLLSLCLVLTVVPAMASADTAGEEKIPLTIARKTDTMIEDLNTNATTLKLEDEFGVDLTFVEYPSEDANAKLAVVMASGSELPDIINFHIDYVTEYNYSTRGLLLPLNEYFDNPEMTKNLDASIDAEKKAWMFQQVSMPDGGIYGMPAYADNMWNKTVYRAWVNTEWLEVLGLDRPKTTD